MRYGAFLLTTASIFPLPAMAQSMPSAGAAAESPAESQPVAPVQADPDDIVVTARRINERLQSTPIAVTALNAQELKARSVNDLSTISQLAPSLHVTSGSAGGNSNAQFFIRGVGQADYLPTADPAVGVYVDGVYMARTTGNLFDLADVQQIEILRGPQGTLFGKNTSGGAISITTRRPGDTLAGMAELTVGNFNRIDGKINVSGPLIGDKLAGSLTFVSRNDDGYGIRLVDGKGAGNTNMQSVRGALYLHDSGNFTYYLTGDYTRRREIPRPVHIEAVLPSSTAATYNRLVLGPVYKSAYDSRYISADPIDTWAGSFTKSDLDVGGISGIGELDLGPATLKLITAWRKQRAVTNVDNDGSPLPVADYFRTIHQSQFSQELQINGKALGDRLTYVGGLYYLREDATIDIQQNTFVGFYAAQLAAGLTRATASDAEIRAHFRQTNDSYAAYANLVFKLTNTIGLSAGVRYSRETKRIGETAYQINRQYSIYRNPNALATPQPIDYFLHDGRTFGAATPTVGIQWQAARGAFFYATFAQGFKSGGFDGRPISGLTSPSSFSPEKVDSYEFGAKLDPFGRLLRLNLTGFHVDYHDMQVSAVIETNGLATNVIRNAGDARINGVEVEALLRPLHGLELSVNGSYLDAKLTSIAPGVPFTINDHLTNTPEWVVNPSIQYSLDLPDRWNVTGRVDYAYTSRVFYDLPNSYSVNAAGTNTTPNGPNYFPTMQPGYGLLNARLTVTKGDWSLAGFITNITDKRYRIYGFSSTTAGITEAYYGPPRQFGATLTRRF